MRINDDTRIRRHVTATLRAALEEVGRFAATLPHEDAMVAAADPARRGALLSHCS